MARRLGRVLEITAQMVVIQVDVQQFVDSGARRWSVSDLDPHGINHVQVLHELGHSTQRFDTTISDE